MSDCSTRAWAHKWSDQAWHKPRSEMKLDADVMTGRVVFTDGTSQPLYYNRMGRRVDCFEMDGARFEDVRKYERDIEALHANRRELESRNAELTSIVRDMHATMRRLDTYMSIHGFDMPSKEFDKRMAKLGIEVGE